jgi:hypothetical protein
MAPLNYAEAYSQALAQAFPYVLNYGALYATPNNGRYRMGQDGKTVYIPRLSTTGRVDANRNTIGTAARNFDNSWEPKTLSNERKWGTLVHPMDIQQTNMVASIQNITQTFNEEKKFPEMDAYLISKLYQDWIAIGKTALTGTLDETNVLGYMSQMLLASKNARSPQGSIFYVTYEVQELIATAMKAIAKVDINSNTGTVALDVDRFRGHQVIGVPAELMMSLYDFTEGWAPGVGAQQIHMFLVHPVAVITPTSYLFSQLDAPSALTEGKWVYYEEAHEDAFILNNKADALQFFCGA